MTDILSLLIVVSSALVGLAIGANSASGCVSTLSGLKMVSFRTSALLVALLMFAGGLLSGGPVVKTVGENILPQKAVDDSMRIAAVSALLATALFVGLLTYESLPVSAGHSLIGALIGSAAGLGLLGSMDWPLLYWIFLAWLLTPGVALVLAFCLYGYINSYLSKRVSLVTFSRTFRMIVIAGTVFLAYGLGANNAGNAAGLVLRMQVISDQTLVLVVVGFFMGLGVLSFSRRVVTTVGKNITVLDPPTVASSQFAAGLTLYIFTLLGVPISSAQAIIGGLVGVGVTKGTGMINGRLVMVIFIGWVLTPLASAALSYVLYWVLCAILGV